MCSKGFLLPKPCLQATEKKKREKTKTQPSPFLPAFSYKLHVANGDLDKLKYTHGRSVILLQRIWWCSVVCIMHSEVPHPPPHPLLSGLLRVVFCRGQYRIESTTPSSKNKKINVTSSITLSAQHLLISFDDETSQLSWTRRAHSQPTHIRNGIIKTSQICSHVIFKLGQSPRTWYELVMPDRGKHHSTLQISFKRHPRKYQNLCFCPDGKRVTYLPWTWLVISKTLRSWWCSHMYQSYTVWA